ncbi:hypothetical protein ACG7TL_007868 [Trametes sanguinea]
MTLPTVTVKLACGDGESVEMQSDALVQMRCSLETEIPHRRLFGTARAKATIARTGYLHGARDGIRAGICTGVRALGSLIEHYVTALARAEDLLGTVTSLEREVKRELASLNVGLEEAFREHEEQFPGFERPNQTEEGEVRRDLEQAAEEMEAEGDSP